jgi:predicted enzyme related to lactoylglutathione lyase
VPIFKDALVVSAYIAGDVMQVQTSFRAPWTEAMQFYADKLKAEGWKVENVMNMGETGMVVAKKDTHQCSVMFGKEDKFSVAQIMVTGLPAK